jgi:hypothetical protein
MAVYNTHHNAGIGSQKELKKERETNHVAAPNKGPIY